MAQHTNDPFKPDMPVPTPQPADIPLPEHDEIQLPSRQDQPPIKTITTNAGHAYCFDLAAVEVIAKRQIESANDYS